MTIWILHLFPCPVCQMDLEIRILLKQRNGDRSKRVCETDDRPWVEMLEVFFIQESQFPREMEFCAAVCAVSHEMAGTSYNGLADRIKPQLVDEAQYHRLLAVRAAEYDIKVLKIYDDHVRNVDNLAPDMNSGIHYSRCVQKKISGVRSD